MTQVSAVTQATDTRELIVESAYVCFGKQGLQKATIVDIAKVAGVSRSTIYEYFRDKAAIVEACAEHASERFYREMSKAMDRGSTLEDKLSRAAVFVTQARRVIASEKYFDEDAVSLLLTKDAAVLLRESVDFFARILFSLFSTPSSTLDMDDPAVVEDFVRAHLVRGFANERPRPRRGQ
jgi:AcrR family transcriptional regulator